MKDIKRNIKLKVLDKVVFNGQSGDMYSNYLSYHSGPIGVVRSTYVDEIELVRHWVKKDIIFYAKYK